MILNVKCVIIFICEEFIIKGEMRVMAKKQHDIGRIATKIIAGFLAVLMVAAFAGTLIYYLVVA